MKIDSEPLVTSHAGNAFPSHRINQPVDKILATYLTILPTMMSRVYYLFWKQNKYALN